MFHKISSFRDFPKVSLEFQSLTWPKKESAKKQTYAQTKKYKHPQQAPESNEIRCNFTWPFNLEN